jgi:hypothetical protein
MKSSVSGMSVARFSRVIQSPARGVDQRRRQLTDLCPVRDHRHQVRGEPAVHATAELGLGIGQASVAIEQEFLIVHQSVLVPSQHALQRNVGEARRNQAGSAGVRGWTCAIPQLVSAATIPASPTSASAWSLAHPLLASSWS